MAKLDDTPLWADVYQLEETDPVIGGTPNPATGAGMDNIPHLQLAQRTSWLKDAVDTLTTAVVAASTTVAGLVRLSTAVNSTSTTTAATPSAVKAANDNAEIRALKSTTLTAGDGLVGGGTLAANWTLAVDDSVVRTARSVTGAGLATGGGSLSADRVITVPAATQAEAEAGTSTTKAMTPKGVAQAIAATVASYVPSARTVVGAGLAKGGGDLSADRIISVPDATQAEAEAGTSTTKAMSPLRVAQAIAKALSGVVKIGTQVVVGEGGGAVALTVNDGGGNANLTFNHTGAVPDQSGNAGRIIVNTDGPGVATMTFAIGSAPTANAELPLAASMWLTEAGLSAYAVEGPWVATPAEAEAGAGNGKIMTPLRVRQAFEAMLAQRRYVSPKTTIANASNYTFTHGLGAVPAMIFVTLECVIAQGGYAVGDVIQMGIDANPDGSNEAIGVKKTATQIVVMIGINGPGVYTVASGGGGIILTAANWKMTVTAIL